MALIDALLGAVADPLWVVDRNRTVVRFNAAFASISEKASFDPVWWQDILERVFSGRSVSADVRVLDRAYTIFGAPVPNQDAAVFTMREIAQAEERENLLELAVARIFAGEKSLEETLREVIEFICSADGWDCAVIWFIDDSGTQLVPSLIWSQPDLDLSKFRERVSTLRFTRGHGIPGRAWLNDEAVWVTDLFDETGYIRGEAAAHAGLHGSVAVPLHDAERITGVLEVLARSVRPLSEQRRTALRRAGQSLGRLIVRRQLEEIISLKGREWTLTFDAIELPVFITRQDGTIVRVNRAARDLAGGEFHEVIGRNIAITSEEPWKTLADVVEAVRDSGTGCTARISEGGTFWDVSGGWFESATDGQPRAIVIMRDITERIRLEESVRRGEQMAALGELVAGVAHEVRNPIFGIGLTIDAMQQVLPDDPEILELFGVLRSWLSRLNRLMENLLAYGKAWTLVLEKGDLGSVLAPVVEGCRQIAQASDVSIEATIEPGLVMHMDATRLSHAFENLIVNAIQHSPSGGRIHVSARADGQDIECAVRDHGPGFDPTEISRIFEPFFTKRRGGTGLGLAIAHRVVDEHGGTISAANAAHGGAVVTIRFPTYGSSERDAQAGSSS